MDSRHLRAFIAVADHGGISIAAERLGYAQSSVSDQLRALERDVGTTVLDRASTGAVLTEAGLRLLPYARRMLELEEQMRRAAEATRPTLRIGALEGLAEQWLPELLTAMDYRGIDADIVISLSYEEDLIADLAADRLDLVFTLNNVGPMLDGPHAVIGTDNATLLAGAHHPLAAKRSVSREDLAGQQFLVKSRTCYCGRLFDQFALEFQPALQLAMITGSLGALRRLVANGRGLTLLPRFSVVEGLESGDLVELDVGLPAEFTKVRIEAHWRAGLGDAEEPLQELISLARHNPPVLPMQNGRRPRLVA